MGDWRSTRPPVWRKFPGPSGQDVLLRVAFGRDAHAEIVAHAKSSLDAEICGVLVGEVCEDDAGLFLDVQAAIRGAAAREAGAHVTFTQETWCAIHDAVEARYPKLQIVGWYHSHPGFGVILSDMDIFIQQNFFPAPTQVALVIDPVSGDEALCVNSGDGVQGLARFWIEGREQRCQLAPDRSDGPKPRQDDALQALQGKLDQLIQVLDEQHSSVYRTLLTFAMVVAFAIVIWIGFQIYLGYVASRYEPPKVLQHLSGQIRVGGETVRLGIPIVEWRVPPQMDLERENQRLREENLGLRRLLQEGAAAKSPEGEKTPEPKPQEGGKAPETARPPEAAPPKPSTNP